MRNERKYVVLTLLSLLLVGLLLVNCGREYFRMAHAEEKQDHEYAALGAQLYAQNCVQCHGPAGEGVVGLPLNRPDLQGDPHDIKSKEIYRMIYDTLVNGRAGRGTTQWVQGKDGKWVSYSQMPAWGRSAGGPMDEHMITALTYFIMMGNEPVGGKEGNPTYWSQIGRTDFPIPPANMEATLPDPNPEFTDLTPAEVAQAKDIIENKLKPSCLTCHTIGSKGGYIGPDLTAVGAWGDKNRDEWEAFLRQWIYDAPSVPAEERMPAYWYVHRAPGPDVNYGVDPISPDPERNKTQMPSFKKYWDENPGDLDLVIEYLMGLVPASKK